jgi:hypothetical protein
MNQMSNLLIRGESHELPGNMARTVNPILHQSTRDSFKGAAAVTIHSFWVVARLAGTADQLLIKFSA